MAFERIVGRMGDLVVVQLKNGQALRGRPTYRRRSSPAQQGASGRLTQATAAWNGLTADQAQAWNRYAATVERHGSLSGEAYTPTGFCTFTGLATKVLQANPEASIPVDPPTSAFEGDSVLVAAEAAEGAVRFAASGANAAGVVTELMLQKLANVRRKPTTRYGSAAFVAYAQGALAHDVPVEPGVYACAYRFVRAATGQATLPQPVGVVVV